VRSEQSTDGTERPWLQAETVIEAVERLRDRALSVEGEPCDQWYGEQLDKILRSHDTATEQGGDSR